MDGHAFETDRLALRPVQSSDADLLFALDSDPEVMRYLSGGPATPLERIRDGILPQFLSYPARAQWAGVWVARSRDSSAFVGWFSLRPPEDLSLGGDLGYRLRRQFWGRGLATEGARFIIDRGFQLGMPRAFGTTYEHNAASRRVMEKLGMQFVRSFRLSDDAVASPGTFAATSAEPWEGCEVEYEIHRDSWFPRRS